MNKIDFHDSPQEVTAVKAPKYQVKLNRDDNWHMDRPHFHEDIEILLSLSDGGDFFIENELYPLSWGELFLIGDATLHKSFSRQSYRRYVLHIAPSTLEELSMPQIDFLSCLRRSVHRVQLDRSQAAELVGLFGQLEQAKENEGFGSDMKATIALLSLLLQVFSYFQTVDRSTVSYNPDFARITPILEYIGENIAEPLTLDSISTRFFMDKYHLCHSFKAVTGFSVMEYVIHCRVLRARELLRTGMRVQEVSEAVGFRNNEHFIRTFGALTGTSPKRYAKEYLAGDRI